MVSPSDEDEREFSYQVQLTGRPPESLRSQYPSMTMHTTSAQTALRRRCEAPEQLDELIREVGAVGLTLTDVHRVAGAARSADDDTLPTPRQSAGSATYELRVAGVLGGALLRHFHCSHYAIPEQTLVRLALAAAELNRFLRACTDCGATLERVRRLDPAIAEVSR